MVTHSVRIQVSLALQDERQAKTFANDTNRFASARCAFRARRRTQPPSHSKLWQFRAHPEERCISEPYLAKLLSFVEQ